MAEYDPDCGGWVNKRSYSGSCKPGKPPSLMEKIYLYFISTIAGISSGFVPFLLTALITKSFWISIIIGIVMAFGGILIFTMEAKKEINHLKG